MITNPDSQTRVDEIAADIYRINTPVAIPSGGTFNFNQYLLVDDEPLLFHTGLRRMFPLVREAIAALMPVEKLRYIGFSHVEADECGAMNLLLDAAPQAVPMCSRVAAMVSMNDLADRAPRAVADGELLVLGKHTVQWFDTPHVPHGWEAGVLMEVTGRTLFCGDWFTQASSGTTALTEDDILGPSEAFRLSMDYYAHAPNTAASIERLARQAPRTLAVMHGSAWRGDGGVLLRDLATAVTAPR